MANRIGKTSLFRAVLLLLLLAPVRLLYAQSNWQYNWQFNFGCDLHFIYGKGQTFPGLRVFTGFSAAANYKNKLLLNYGPSLSVYTKGLGANLNPLVGDWQMDFTNAFSLGYGWDDVSYTKYFRTLNNGSYYNIATNKAYAVFLSSNFVVNNHKRNQVVGAVSFSAPGVTINYYNDGAAPFNLLPLADNFDRWWTGGLAVFLHTRKDYNRGEFTFDQFTGYSPLLYELSSVLGINVPQYSQAGNDTTVLRSKIPPSFNTSAYNARIFLDKGYGVNVGAIGSLIDNAGRTYGLQDIIHMLGGYALHPNSDITRFYIGGTYNNLRHGKF